MKEEHTHRLFELILAHAEGAKVKPIEVFSEVNAIEIPKNATNGDVIEAMFSVETIDDFCHSFGVRLNNSNYIQFNKNWWNAPYRRETE